MDEHEFYEMGYKVGKTGRGFPTKEVSTLGGTQYFEGLRQGFLARQRHLRGCRRAGILLLQARGQISRRKWQF